MYTDSVLNSFLDKISNSYYVCDSHLPSNAINGLRYYKRGYFYFLGCKDNFLYFYGNNSNLNLNSNAILLEYNILSDSFSYNTITLGNGNDYQNFVNFVVGMNSNYSDLSVFANNTNDYSDSFKSRIKVNNDNYDDFINTTQPSEYIVSLLYFAIPLIIFLLAIKVLRKGLFK